MMIIPYRQLSCINCIVVQNEGNTIHQRGEGEHIQSPSDDDDASWIAQLSSAEGSTL